MVEIAFTEGDGRINAVPMVLAAIVRTGFPRLRARSPVNLRRRPRRTGPAPFDANGASQKGNRVLRRDVHVIVIHFTEPSTASLSKSLTLSMIGED